MKIKIDMNEEFTSLYKLVNKFKEVSTTSPFDFQHAERIGHISTTSEVSTGRYPSRVKPITCVYVGHIS